MAAITLAEIGRLAKVVIPASPPGGPVTAAPGDVITAHLALPIPQDRLGAAAVYVADITWHVTTTNPVPDADGTATAVAPPAVLGTDYVAPGGLTGLTTAVALFPPFAAGAAVPAPTTYWLVARVILNWATDLSGAASLAPTGAILQTPIEKSSGPINATGLSQTDLAARVLDLFKVELPALPVQPGAPLTAKLRPKGAEDSPWDVESATEIAPQFDLAARVPLEPLFRPLGRIINGVFGVGNQIIGAGAKLFTPLIKAIGALGKAMIAVVDAIPGVSAPKLGALNTPNVLRTIDNLVRRLRIRDVDLFRGLELPIDANLVNRNFTKNLIPHDAVPPLPGPRSILPSLPTLENQLEVMDQIPEVVSMIPIAGNLAIPLALTSVSWELARNNTFSPAAMLAANEFRELDHTAGRLLKRVFAIEPPPADATYYLRVGLTYTINSTPANPGVAALAGKPRIPGVTTTLPSIPIRVLGFDPLAFLAQQCQLHAAVDEVEAGDPVIFILQSAIPLPSRSPTQLVASFPLGALPLRTLTIDVAWEALDENLGALVEGTGFAQSGTESDARAVLFAPVIQVLRRENPAAAMRYVQVRLTSGALAPQVIGPVGVPMLPVVVPLFVAFFRPNTFFGGRQDNDTVQVLVPSFYTSYAPSWVESWETFRDRANALAQRLGRLVAAATRTSNAMPAAAGSLQDLAGAVVERLTLLRTALDYLANRPATGKLEFMRGESWSTSGVYGAFYNSPGITLQPFVNPSTIIVVNDANTTFDVRARFEAGEPRGNQALVVEGTQDSPVCVIWPVELGDGYHWLKWIPLPLFNSWVTGIDVTSMIIHDVFNTMEIRHVRCQFDQAPGKNDELPAPAAVWKAIAS